MRANKISEIYDFGEKINKVTKKWIFIDINEHFK